VGFQQKLYPKQPYHSNTRDFPEYPQLLYSSRLCWDIVNDGEHTITLKTDTVAADQFSVSWGFFGVLVSLDINGSRFDPYSISSANRIRMEDVSSAAVFYSSMTGTYLVMKVQEGSLPNPTSPYIGAWVFKRNLITLNPHQDYMFDVPVLNGWTYAYGIIDANITLSLYPQLYPFKLVNLAVYDPDQAPLLATPTNTTFGISNLSDQRHTAYTLTRHCTIGRTKRAALRIWTK
jgi:hypothetical protein